MRQRRMSLLCGITAPVLLFPGSSAGAQLGGSLGLGSGVGQSGSGIWVRESRLTPTARFVLPQGFLNLNATAVEHGGSFALERAAIEGAGSTPSFGVFRATFGGTYARDVARVGNQPKGSASTALSAKVGAGGIWIGGLHDGNAARGQVGAWRTLRSAIISLSTRTRRGAGSMHIGTRPDSIPNDTVGGWNYFSRPDTSFASEGHRFSDVEARVDWSGGRFALTGTMSASRAATARQDSSTSAGRRLVWGSVNASVLVDQRVSVIAGIGSYPAAAGEPGRSSRFATVGVRFAPAALRRDPLPPAIRPAASAFSVRLLEPGTYRVVLRAPGARTVDLSGDFNGWSPVAMQEAAPGVWEVTVALRPGTHRVNVRVDGDAWASPPGLPSVNDEFNGRVGILVVR
jgi:hypothetical protein